MEEIRSDRYKQTGSGNCKASLNFSYNSSSFLIAQKRLRENFIVESSSCLILELFTIQISDMLFS